MQNIERILIIKSLEAFKALYDIDLEEKIIAIQKTRKELDGDYTLVVFPLLRFSKKNPEQTANDIGNWLVKNVDSVAGFNVVKGFLNLILHHRFWINFLQSEYQNNSFGQLPTSGKRVLIEYSSPNTNKPLHLGHIRNNLLGWSVAQILKANGHDVVKVNLVNDRGIHICKSMLAWQRYGNGETPESSGIKGDHLIGKYYVLFDKYYREEVAELEANGMEKERATKEAPLLKEAQEMLKKWEAGEEAIRALWSKLNGWTYEGFDKTYTRLGIDFDKTYYESNTYLLGKEIIEKGLASNVFYQKEDTSTWIDLTKDNLDEKLLLRADGTSVYMTQDLGTAVERHQNYHPDQMIYVVGNEQNYHFDVLKMILGKLSYSWSKNIYHLSYGMVELPDGKMKSREGKVVDADDLMDEMFNTAKQTAITLGKIDNFDNEEANLLYQKVSLGALKYFMLKVDPKKKMLFIPEDSIDFNGNTGPFIQYTYVRILSLLRKVEEIDLSSISTLNALEPKEISLLKMIYSYTETVAAAGEGLSPSLVANYAYALAKEYNKFYQELPIVKEEDEQHRLFRLQLSSFTAQVIKSALWLLGIDVPERM